MVENKYYERKIKYLDLMENGERVGGAGFIKTEVKGMDINFTIVVKGLHPTDTYERDVMLQAGDGEFAMGRIALKQGQGEFKYHTVMDHSQLQGIRIALGGIREICCKWQEEKRSSVVKKNVVRESAASENGRQANETASNAAEGKKEEKQRGTKKSREIQLIPWDEIKVVEESLDRVEKIMSNSTGNDTWRAAERTEEKEMTEEGTAERGLLARETAERVAMGRSETGETAERAVMKRKTIEGWSGTRETAERAAMEEKMPEGWSETGQTAERAAMERETTEGRSKVRETAERVVMKGKMPERWSETGETAERAVMERETTEGWSETGDTTERTAMERETAERAAMNRETATRRTVAKERMEREGTVRGTAGSTMGGKGAAEKGTSAGNRILGRERRAEEAAGKSGRTGGNSIKTGGRSMKMENRTPVRLREDKWQQIWAIYPHIHPFQDEREYLSISPADFVLLPDEAYRAANNSFLLHGYYNYDHLILTRIEKRGEVFYYIGVPGNYYEREKQVAIMFGFESFECGTEPAQAGDFGYYMMRTQL